MQNDGAQKQWNWKHWALVFGGLLLAGLLCLLVTAGVLLVAAGGAFMGLVSWAQTQPPPAPPTNIPTWTLVPLTVTPRPTLSPPLNAKLGEPWLAPTDGMPLLYVPAGDFLMGSTETDSQAKSAEKPQHTVYLDAFWIDQTEVTNAMYARCVQGRACQPPFYAASIGADSYYGNAHFDHYPILSVTWDEARIYCEWAGRRLPTEAEWEKAARGADGRLYPWGNAAPSQMLTDFDQYRTFPPEVGNSPRAASPYGALDMVGYLSEWVNDWWAENYYRDAPSRNPLGPATGISKVVRGGIWDSSLAALRVANRVDFASEGFRSNLGFRCAASAGK